MAIQAGKLDRLISIEYPTYIQDSFGQPITTWNSLVTLRARIIFPTAVEQFRSGALHSERYGAFFIRYRTDVTEVMRIVYQDLHWKITGIREMGRRRNLEITAMVVK